MQSTCEACQNAHKIQLEFITYPVTKYQIRSLPFFITLLQMCPLNVAIKYLQTHSTYEKNNNIILGAKAYIGFDTS